MSDKKKAASFRSSLGGFNKKDVVDYITDENRRFSEDRADFEEKLKERDAEITELKEKLEAAEKSNYILKIAKDETSSKLNECTRLSEQAEAALRDMTAKYEQALADKETAEKERDNAAASIKNAIEESERLHALVDGCTAQIEKYTDRISELEASLQTLKNGSNDGKSRNEELVRENEYLKRLYAQLQKKFEDTAAYVSNLEKKVYSLREAIDKSSSASPVCREHIGFDSGKSANSVSDISEKAINTIKAINSDVKEYMDSCVDEFDSYSHDVSSSICKLLEDINERCRQLDSRINEHRSNVSKNIDSRFGNYDN